MSLVGKSIAGKDATKPSATKTYTLATKGSVIGAAIGSPSNVHMLWTYPHKMIVEPSGDVTVKGLLSASIVKFKLEDVTIEVVEGSFGNGCTCCAEHALKVTISDAAFKPGMCKHQTLFTPSADMESIVSDLGLK